MIVLRIRVCFCNVLNLILCIFLFINYTFRKVIPFFYNFLIRIILLWDVRLHGNILLWNNNTTIIFVCFWQNFLNLTWLIKLFFFDILIIFNILDFLLNLFILRHIIIQHIQAKRSDLLKTFKAWITIRTISNNLTWIRLSLYIIL